MIDSFEYDVFLSHSAKDKRIVRQLAQRLKSHGLRVCLDEKGLEQSRTQVLVMSKNAFASDWVTLERHTLLFRDPTNQQRRFIPLLIDPCTIPDTIAQFKYIDWKRKIGTGKKLFCLKGIPWWKQGFPLSREEIPFPWRDFPLFSLGLFT